MIIGVLATDGGPHPADKWAEATSSHIVSVAEHLSGEKRGAAIKLQAAIIDILEGHHTTVQTGERTTLQTLGVGRLAHPLDCCQHLDLDEVVVQIIDAAKSTPWEADFNADGMAASLKTLLSSHFHTSMHIERSWHADRNPRTKEAVAFRINHNVGA